MKYLYTDVDDVLLQYFSSFKRYAAEHFGCSFNMAEPIQWDLSHWINGDWKAAIRSFNTSKFFGALEPFPDAVEAMRVLKNDFKIIAIS